MLVVLEPELELERMVLWVGRHNWEWGLGAVRCGGRRALRPSGLHMVDLRRLDLRRGSSRPICSWLSIILLRARPTNLRVEDWGWWWWCSFYRCCLRRFSVFPSPLLFVILR